MYSYYRSDERIHTVAGWGTSSETFFPSENEKYLRFGNLVQVTHSTLNIDSGNSGMKLHRNIELIDINLKGTVGFQDSDGGVSTFPENSVRVVSAGKGLYLMEYNTGMDVVEKLQIGFLPNTLNKPPVKTKALFDLQHHRNSFVEIVSPYNDASLTVRQQAAVLVGEFEADRHFGYTVNNNGIGLFVYIINGVASIHNEILRSGDSVGIIDEEQTLLHTAERSKLLLIEVSLND